MILSSIDLRASYFNFSEINLQTFKISVHLVVYKTYYCILQVLYYVLLCVVVSVFHSPYVHHESRCYCIPMQLFIISFAIIVDFIFLQDNFKTTCPIAVFLATYKVQLWSSASTIIEMSFHLLITITMISVSSSFN